MPSKYEKIVLSFCLCLALICFSVDLYLVYETQKAIDAYEEKIAKEREKQTIRMEKMFKRD